MSKKTKKSSSIPRTKIKESVVRTLWAISAGRCEICNRILYSDLKYGNYLNFSDKGHIHAVSPNGPRYVEDMTKDERNDISNLMLLCKDHHHMIDTEEDYYKSGYLLELKRSHEDRIRCVTEISEDKSCRIVTYFTDIQKHSIFFSKILLKQAVLSNHLYPKQDPLIPLHRNTVLTYTPTKSDFLDKEKSLKKQFKSWFDEIVKTEDTIAVFSLAPQPLLFRLGRLINDQYNAKVFQCHRNDDKWSWRKDSSRVDYLFRKTKEERDSTEVALIIDLSATVSDRRITNVIGDKCTIYHISIDTPNRDFVTNERIQNDFVKVFRIAMETMKNLKYIPKKIHVFPVMPNSLAIKAGMDYMPKTDLPLVIYEQSNPEKGFFETITIDD